MPNSINVPHTKDFTTNLFELFKGLKDNLKQAINKQEKFANQNRIKNPKILKKISPVTYKIDFPKIIRINTII